MTLQDALASAIKARYPDAEIKKINVDEYVDIHVPMLHSKRGTHLFFKTSVDRRTREDNIHIGFYCRDEGFVEACTHKSTTLEAHSRGIRLAGNPALQNEREAIIAALDLAALLERSVKDKEVKVEEAELADTAADGKAGVQVYHEAGIYRIGHSTHPSLIHRIDSDLTVADVASVICAYALSWDELLLPRITAGEFDDDNLVNQYGTIEAVDTLELPSGERISIAVDVSAEDDEPHFIGFGFTCRSYEAMRDPWSDYFTWTLDSAELSGGFDISGIEACTEDQLIIGYQYIAGDDWIDFERDESGFSSTGKWSIVEVYCGDRKISLDKLSEVLDAAGVDLDSEEAVAQALMSSAAQLCAKASN